jgi:hypothetical protein
MYLAKSKLEPWLVAAFSLLFIIVSAYLGYLEKYFIYVVPVVLLIGFLVLFAPQKLFFALIFLAPLSITLRFLVPNLPFDFWFPTEPILVFLLGILILKSLKQRYFQPELKNHPFFWSIIFFLGWIFITAVTSELVVVSIKYFLVRFWFIGVFFYLAFIYFRQDKQNINRFLWAYILGLLVVVLFALVKQAGFGFLNQRAAHGASSPFFIDHTSYGAALAFSIPILSVFAYHAKTLWKRLIYWSLTILFVAALIFSYSRAAIAGSIIGILLFFFMGDIIRNMEKNTTESSGDLMEHVRSIYNIKTDASNMERVNRWNAAIDMFEERPVFGWGPGTYMFLYAPFQRSYNKTVISTNFGTGGNAHSEYLGLMAETGFLGALGYILILTFTLIIGFRGISKIKDIQYRRISLACIMGLITYIAHGFLNNFLDADKIAAPFWGFIAIVVALNIQEKQLNAIEEEAKG